MLLTFFLSRFSPQDALSEKELGVGTILRRSHAVLHCAYQIAQFIRDDVLIEYRATVVTTSLHPPRTTRCRG